MPTNDKDRLVRQVRSCGAEFRARDEGGPVIEGYFSVFNRDYELWPGAVEQVAPGAFRETLGGDIRALNEQDSDAMNLYARVQRGDVSQCSFGFDILDEEFTERSDGSVLWTIRKVKLYEVSVVTFPAYVETAVSARKAEVDTIRRRRLDAWKNEMKERMKKWH